MSKATPKKEAFAMAVHANGGNQSAAYREAYDTARMKDETVAKRACELMKDGYVAGRLAELQAAVRQKYDITLEGQVETYMEMLQEARDIDKMLYTDADGKQIFGGTKKEKLEVMVKIMARLDKIAGLEVAEKDTGPAQYNIVYIDKRMTML